ncbi:DNA ligase [Ideonella azotifigens]|uniref:DNA ligase n=1 Tax=Ideonella azotifigens TaxID=513160 RepID=A0ABP3VPC2_9BURK|nr:DNA ligase [Ideonella azotifigens]MCD2343053.1 DNA ligase [Ideonella azotifigens]
MPPKSPSVSPSWLLGLPALLSTGLGGQVLAATAPIQAVAESAPTLLLARELGPDVSPAPYLVSEKFDGVRGLWDGRRLRFRGGGEIQAPAWFLAQLPTQPLDGELWLGRGRFDEVSALLRRGDPADPGWRALQYRVFELPGGEGNFEQRTARLAVLAPPDGAGPVRAVAQFRVADRVTLQQRLQEVVAGGGEGLALHLADAPYLTGRNGLLLKFKPVQDADAVVIGHVPGKGKYAGQIGALRVRNDDGQVFLLGSGLSDAQRRSPPPLGSRLSYSWRGQTDTGLPRFATLLRLRDAGT